ncbi:thioredoxin domain-containing protein [Bacillus altitudinis]|nr:DUF255 domain-containing protein [Bacillus altitudinis]MBY0187290.1 DUF255 domain-containing protein [Bacillus aerophilus]MCW4356629.1 thioredoxin domain-containing protein [Bacillus altitudinis]MCY7579176.1 thioredoxin domain-containing protein [Bacillus altitudinis]MCY7593552.1 thioredoxin domain-containing protein [Bacillus altitudinis]
MPNNQTPTPLITEKSPYLLQHAHNPVHWYPWGQEAFDKAKRENKPVLVSIGYATCHWCHVCTATHKICYSILRLYMLFYEMLVRTVLFKFT